LDVPERKLRFDLIEEEFNELREALEADDIVEVADALGDIAYVVYGAAKTFGIPLDEVVDEIHRSNMSKLGEDGKPIYRESDRKVLKGENYFPPNIKAILDAKKA
jgi:predicted HAD superfamily Cof-like phosphohydrolase